MLCMFTSMFLHFRNFESASQLQMHFEKRWGLKNNLLPTGSMENRNVDRRKSPSKFAN